MAVIFSPHTLLFKNKKTQTAPHDTTFLSGQYPKSTE
jgi:hypothetical protein